MRQGGVRTASRLTEQIQDVAQPVRSSEQTPENDAANAPVNAMKAAAQLAAMQAAYKVSKGKSQANYTQRAGQNEAIGQSPATASQAASAEKSVPVPKTQEASVSHPFKHTNTMQTASPVGQRTLTVQEKAQMLQRNTASIQPAPQEAPKSPGASALQDHITKTIPSKSVIQDIKLAKGDANRSIKTADHTVKGMKQAVSPAKFAIGTPAPVAAKAKNQTRAAARKSMEKASRAVLNAIRFTARSLVAAVSAGTAAVALILVVLCIIGILFCSPFGIFFSSEADNELTIQAVLTQLSTEFNERITEIENAVAHDDVQQSGSQASQKDVLAVYAVKITTDPDNPLDAVTMDEQRAEILREIFWAMNQINYSTETYTEEETVQVPNEASDAEEGDMIEQTQTVERTRLLITITGKTAEEMAAEYGFTQEQLSYLTELLSDDYTELWYGLPFGTGSGSGDLVAVALSQLGTVGGRPYWSWYGFSYRVAWCACFVSWCADQCGYIDSGLMPKFSYCDDGIAWFKAQGRWQGRNYIPAPGDIIFFDWGLDGVSDHVGIVESCDGTTVYTIEGNANDNVKQLSYAVGYSKIMGYGVISP
jgi:hypothetical protein